jgi:protein ImuA
MFLARSPAALDALRRQVRLSAMADCAHGAVLPFGVGAIDQRLPGGGLALGALHEGALHGAAAASFAAGILARSTGPCSGAFANVTSLPLHWPRPACRPSA